MQSNTKADDRIGFDVWIHVHDPGSGTRVGLEGTHRAAPTDINWTGICSELATVLNFNATKGKGRIGRIRVRGEHFEYSEIVGSEIPEKYLKKDAYMDTAIIKHASGVL